MKTPALSASMDRRLLVNYRVDPDILASRLPSPFRPALVGGHGVAGICLLRLRGVRPVGFPAAVGLASENAAHRVAVEWDTTDGTATGVYVPRRDTSSRLSALAGGRLFPGRQHRARFDVVEGDGRYRIGVTSLDGEVDVYVDASVSERVMAGSVFDDLDAASRFFRSAPVGYAPASDPGAFDGVELGTDGWAMTPVHLAETRSSFFDDPRRFPPGTATPDSAFLMAGICTTWSARPRMRADGLATVAGAASR